MCYAFCSMHDKVRGFRCDVYRGNFKIQYFPRPPDITLTLTSLKLIINEQSFFSDINEKLLRAYLIPYLTPPPPKEKKPFKIQQNCLYIKS